MKTVLKCNYTCPLITRPKVMKPLPLVVKGNYKMEIQITQITLAKPAIKSVQIQIQEELKLKTQPTVPIRWKRLERFFFQFVIRKLQAKPIHQM